MAQQANYSTLSSGESIARPGSSASMGNGSRSGSRRPLTRRRKSTSGAIAGQASLASSVVNLLNTIVGAGVLAMPLAMSHMGMTLGTFVIIFSAAAAGFGLYLQSRCARYVERGTASFFALSQLTYPSAAVVFDAAIAIKCFGVGVSYLIIIGDLMPQIAYAFTGGRSQGSFGDDRHFWVTFFMLVVIPLSFLRRLDSLKYTSFVALVSIAYLVIIVVAHFIKGDTLAQRGAVNYFRWSGPVSVLSSFPIIVFAYTCHQNMFSIVNEIKDNSQKQKTRVVGLSVGIAAAIYVLVAITGYLSFGDQVGGNIIAMYKGAVASTIGRAAIVVLVMFSYPLQVHPCRASIDNILKWRPQPANKPILAPPPSPIKGGDSMSDLRFAIITTVIIVLSYTTAMTVSSLERVLAYVGSTGSTSISFILPGLFYWRITRPGSMANKIVPQGGEADEEEADEDEEYGTRWQERWLRNGALGLSIYGVIVMITCLTMNIFFSAGGH